MSWYFRRISTVIVTTFGGITSLVLGDVMWGFAWLGAGCPQGQGVLNCSVQCVPDLNYSEKSFPGIELERPFHLMTIPRILLLLGASW